MTENRYTIFVLKKFRSKLEWLLVVCTLRASSGACKIAHAVIQPHGVSDDVNPPCPIRYSFSEQSDSKPRSPFIFAPFGGLRPPVVLRQTASTHPLTAGFTNYSLSPAQTLEQEGHY